MTALKPTFLERQQLALLIGRIFRTRGIGGHNSVSAHVSPLLLNAMWLVVPPLVGAYGPQRMKWAQLVCHLILPGDHVEGVHIYCGSTWGGFTKAYILTETEESALEAATTKYKEFLMELLGDEYVPYVTHESPEAEAFLL